MFVPVGDSPNPPGTPVVNWALIALNVAVFVLITVPLSQAAVDPTNPLLPEYIALVRDRVQGAMTDAEIVRAISAYDLFVFEHGFRPREASIPTLFSSMFLHGGFAHLAGNMLFLWIYGDNIEHRLGRAKYLLAYLVSGVAATTFHAAFDMESNTPMVGASGAISGVLGFYFILFPRNLVKVFVLLFPFFMQVVQIPARIVLGFYIVVSNILPFMASAGMGGGGVAYGAHIGGFVAGIAGAAIANRLERDRTPREYRHEHPADGFDSDALSSLVRAGRFAEASERYFAASPRQKRRVSPRDALLIGRWLSENGHPQAALSAFRNVLRDHPTGPVAADAHLGAGLVQLRNLGRPVAAYQHFLDVIDVAPDSQAADLAREGLAHIDGMGRG